MTLTVRWIDGHAEPREPANPAYPDGIDLDPEPKAWGCKAALPYPAKGIGAYIVECNICGTRIGCTTAGRRDDPRSIRVPCATGRA
jgi:hypothetical protein